MKKHGFAPKDKSSRHPLYGIWCDMKKRCLNPNYRQYSDYGGRGIRVCDSWSKDFMSFVSDMGPRPSPSHTIDRIENDGNYDPGNCRWATRAEQSLNTRRNRLVLFNGELQPLVVVAKATGQHHTSIIRKLAQNMPMEKVVVKLKRPRTFLSCAEKNAIRALVQMGDSQRSVATKYNIAQSYVSKLVHGVEIAP